MTWEEILQMMVQEINIGVHAIPRTTTLLSYLLSTIFLNILWRKNEPDHLLRNARIFLFTLLWIIPWDITWWSLSILRWNDLRWWMQLQPLGNWYPEILMIWIAWLGNVDVAKKKMIYWDKWTILMLVSHTIYIALRLGLAQIPQEFGMFRAEGEYYAINDILTIHIPTKIADWLGWLVWIRPWKKRS